MKQVILLFMVFLLFGCGSSGGGSADAASGVTLDKLAGVWDYMGSGTVVIDTDVCGFSFRGTITVASNGSADLDQIENNSCSGEFSGQITGSIAVSSDGSGTLTTTNPAHFQVSKDLNTIIFAGTSSSVAWTSGTALRR